MIYKIKYLNKKREIIEKYFELLTDIISYSHLLNLMPSSIKNDMDNSFNILELEDITK